MSRPHFDYGVVILNYNVATDAIAAAKSINENAFDEAYRICIVDNNSSKKEDSELLNNSNIPNCDILLLQDNGGYSKGNNAGMRFLLDHYDVDFFVIMNPDVLLIQKGTIDILIKKLKSLDDSYCGIQPLVWTPCLGDVHYQVHVRKVPTYWDMMVNHFGPLSRICRNQQISFFYLDAIPYESDIDFYVPSGAFFIMKANEFRDIDLFDERTFLYNEEYIIGYKIKEKGKKFLLCVNEIVQHEGGKSISSHSKMKSWAAEKYEMASSSIYLKYYLKKSSFCRFFISFLICLNYEYHHLKALLKHRN